MNKETPVLSVVIPIFNDHDKIRIALNRFNESDFKNFELILIDDCSEDKRLKELYKKSENKNTRIFFNKENKGPSYSRNRGAKLARGSIVFFTDADCYIFKDTLGKIYDFFRVNKDVNCLGGTYTVNSYSNKFFDNFHSLNINYFETKTTLVTYLSSHCLAMRTALFLKSGGFIEGKLLGRKPNVEDVYFGLSLHKKGIRLFKKKDLQVCHDPGYNIAGSMKNTFKKSFSWMKLSMHYRNLTSDCGAASHELKMNGIIVSLLYLTLFSYPFSL